jgi:hypothetical protein
MKKIFLLFIASLIFFHLVLPSIPKPLINHSTKNVLYRTIILKQNLVKMVQSGELLKRYRINRVCFQ